MNSKISQAQAIVNFKTQIACSTNPVQSWISFLRNNVRFFGGSHNIIWEEHVFLTSTGARCIHHVATMGAGAEEVVIRPHYLDHYQHANDHQNNINWTLIQPQMQMTI